MYGGHKGAENGDVAAMQRFFRRSVEDDFAGEKRFMFGKSASNQRIEASKGHVRTGCAEWWIKFFKDLRNLGCVMMMMMMMMM